LQAKLGNDAIHGALADAEVTLAQFLGYDLGTGLGIQEAVANHLADEFLGAAVVGFGSPFGTEETLAALGKEERPELEIALAAITELGGNLVNVFGSAFTGQKHGQFAGDLIVFGNRQGAESTLDAFFKDIDGNHGRPPDGSARNSLIIYDTI